MTESEPSSADSKRDAASPAFLRGGGSMGALLRARDWRDCPFGPPDRWPQSLRTVIRLMLTSNHPLFVFWGPDHRCFYNDAYAESLGPEKHPAILAAPGRDAFLEIWPIIAPQIESVMAGQGATWFEDHLVPMFRHGRMDEVYWTYGYSPIDDDAAPGGIGGVLVICAETTDRVLAEKRDAFLIRLGDRLRDLQEPEAMLAGAAAALGEHLGADATGYAEVDGQGVSAAVGRDWWPEAVPNLVGTHHLDDFGAALAAELRAGRLVAVSDVADHPLIPASAQAAYAELGVGAMILAPLLAEDRLRGILFVHSQRPRAWREEDRRLVSDVAARTSGAVASARAQRALIESERLLRAIGASSGELIFAKDSAHRMLYANPATLAVIGKPASEVIGRSEAEWHDDPDQARVIMANDREVMNTGDARRVEEVFTGPDGDERIYEGIKSPLRDEAGVIVGVVGVTTDVTERNRAQRQLQLMVDELNHRVKNTLTIVQSIAHQSFRGEPISSGAKRAFEDRLAALAAANALLTRERWESADIEEVARSACAPHPGADRIEINGPPLRLAPKTAVTIAMALHELCTNASKYGALSVERGRARFNWDVVYQGEPGLYLRWEESSGPPVVPPKRRGFGTRMIEQALAYDLQGTTRLDFAPTGLVCTITAPLPEAI